MGHIVARATRQGILVEQKAAVEPRPYNSEQALGWHSRQLALCEGDYAGVEDALNTLAQVQSAERSSCVHNYVSARLAAHMVTHASRKDLIRLGPALLNCPRSEAKLVADAAFARGNAGGKPFAWAVLKFGRHCTEAYTNMDATRRAEVAETLITATGSADLAHSDNVDDGDKFCAQVAAVAALGELSDADTEILFARDPANPALSVPAYVRCVAHGAAGFSASDWLAHIGAVFSRSRDSAAGLIHVHRDTIRAAFLDQPFLMVDPGPAWTEIFEPWNKNATFDAALVLLTDDNAVVFSQVVHMLDRMGVTLSAAAVEKTVTSWPALLGLSMVDVCNNNIVAAMETAAAQLPDAHILFEQPFTQGTREGFNLLRDAKVSTKLLLWVLSRQPGALTQYLAGSFTANPPSEDVVNILEKCAEAGLLQAEEVVDMFRFSSPPVQTVREAAMLSTAELPRLLANSTSFDPGISDTRADAVVDLLHTHLGENVEQWEKMEQLMTHYQYHTYTFAELFAQVSEGTTAD